MKHHLPRNGNKVMFVKPMSILEAYRQLMEFKDNIWRYTSLPEKREDTSGEDVKSKIIRAYSRISRTLPAILEKCEFRTEQETVTIHVPKEFRSFVGKLIGAQGVNIRYVEQEVGLKIRITQEEPPKEVEIRQKIEKLLKNLAKNENKNTVEQ